MSGKKSKLQPNWFDCSKCNRRLTRLSYTKHYEQNCLPIYPFIYNSILYSQIKSIPSNSKINGLPFTHASISSSLIFFPVEIMKEYGLVTLNWIKIKKNDEPTSTPVLFRLWPVVGEAINIISLTSQGLFQNFIDKNEVFIFEKMENEKTLRHLDEIAIELIEDACPSIDDPSRFVETFKRNFKNRAVHLGNKFRMNYYTSIVVFKISSLKCSQSSEESSENNEISLSEKLNQLNIKDDTLEFGEITQETKIIVNRPTEFEEKKTVEESEDTLEKVGGYRDIITELTSTVNYLLTMAPKGNNYPKGILIHGHHGTGKSFIIRSFCNSFKLKMIVFNEFTSISNPVSLENNLKQIFREALRNEPAAIIIENLDTLASIKSTFSAILKKEMESIVLSKKIIIFASATDLDAVDPSLRSYHIFAKEIEIPVPTLYQRKEILEKILKLLLNILPNQEIDLIAAETHGFVGDDLKALLSESSLKALKESKNQLTKCNFTLINVQECLKLVRPSAIKSILIDVPNVHWEDIGGQEDLKFKLKQAIEWPLKHPEVFKRLGITPPKGILMYGPPGCSKTMIAKAIATESGLNFISVKGSELFSKWVGDSEKAVRNVFQKARQVSPCIVFFDEIDSIGSERGASSGASNVHERVLAQLLIEIDGIEPLKDVTIVAATNRPDIIDPALLRPGRLDRIIYVPMPDEKTRLEILKIQFKKMPIDKDLNIDKIVKDTEGYSGAELTAVCHEAALKALEENINARIIEESHFQSALKSITPRISSEQIAYFESFKMNSEAKRSS